MSDKDTPNPYAAPLDYRTAEPHLLPDSPFADGTPPVGLWRQGKLLVMAKNAQLPDRCVKSNQPTNRRLKRNLYWHHPAVYLAIFLHLLIYIILALILRKTATVYIGLSDAWFAKRLRAILIGWILSLVSIGLFVIGVMHADGDTGLVWLIVVGSFLFIGALLYGLIGSRMVTAKRVSDHYVWIKGVHPDFLADLPPWPHQYG